MYTLEKNGFGAGYKLKEHLGKDINSGAEDFVQLQKRQEAFPFMVSPIVKNNFEHYGVCHYKITENKVKKQLMQY